MSQLEYDPILVTFMSTLGESLQTRSHSIILEEFLRIVTQLEYKDQDIPTIDVRNLISEGLEYKRKSSKKEREEYAEKAKAENARKLEEAAAKAGTSQPGETRTVRAAKPVATVITP